MSEKKSTAFNPKNFNNPNIVVKSLSAEKADNQKNQEHRQLEAKIEKLKSEKKAVWFKRDDYNNIVREHQRKANELRDKRDELNAKVSKDSQLKKELESKKDQLLNKKREIGEAIDNETDKAKKFEMYKEFSQVKDELNDAFETLKEIRSNFRELREESTECHHNYLVYKKLEAQSRKEANQFHNEGKEISREINKLYKKLKANRGYRRNR